MEITDTRFRQLARDLYQDEGRIEIDDHAVVSRGKTPIEGAYVQAWVWVGSEDEDNCGTCGWQPCRCCSNCRRFVVPCPNCSTEEEEEEPIYCGNCGMSHTEPECGNMRCHMLDAER